MIQSKSIRQVTVRTVRIEDIAANEWNLLRKTKPVILFGSFLSTYADTSLPSGENVSAAIFELFFPSFENIDIPSFREDFQQVPFEALMEAHPDQSGIPDALIALYGSRTTNPIYRALVRGIRRGLLSSLITTNYDSALEGGIEDGDLIKAVRSADEWDGLDQCDANIVPLLKIHGSAEPRYRKDLVFDLRREGKLSSWKREALRSLLAGRHLLILGFSGRDFDVCPEIASMEDLAGLYWLQPNLAALSAQARVVLQRRAGTLVLGDLSVFLEKFFEEPVAAQRATGGVNAAPLFHRANVDLWRLRVLDRLACVRLAEPLVNRLGTLDAATTRQFRINMAAHAGRYREIATLADDAAAAAGNSADFSLWQLRASFGWLAYGRLDLANACLNKAEVAASAIDNMARRAEVLSECLQSRLTLVMRRAQIARLARQRRRFNALREEARSLEDCLLEELTERGALDSRQAVRHNTQRLDIAQPGPWPLPAEIGYGALGLRSMVAIRARDWIRSHPWWLSAERVKAARSWIAMADAYGWRHESWKLRWIFFWRCPPKLRSWNPRRVQRHLQAAWRDFFSVEYAAKWRLFQALYSVIPNGDASAFDADALAQLTPPLEPRDVV